MTIQEVIKKYNVYIQINYYHGYWCYVLIELPTEKDIAFGKSGECQDGDLWLHGNVINSDWFEQEYKSYDEALEAGMLNIVEHFKLKEQ